jgi:hypothetical protein
MWNFIAGNAEVSKPTVALEQVVTMAAPLLGLAHGSQKHLGKWG